MINHIVAILLALSLIALLSLWVYTLVYCESKRRYSFLLLLMVVFLFVLGHLVMITASTVGGAFAGKRVEYLGSAFLTPITVFFVLEYCEIKLNNKLKALLLVIPCIVVVLLWTTELHGLLYTTFEFNTSSAVYNLRVERGSLYYLNHVYSFLLVGMILVVLVHHFFTKDRKHRIKLCLLMFTILTPACANLLHALRVRALNGINFTPLSMTIVCIVFWFVVVKKDLFDIVPRAMESALQSLKEALILVDEKNGFLHANEAAKEIFSGLKTLNNEEAVDEIEYWPKQLTSLEDKIEKKSSIKFEIAKTHYAANVSNIVSKKGKSLGYIIIIQDETQTVLLTKQLEEMASMDDLTKVYNRRFFMQLAALSYEKCVREKRPCGAFMLDLDFFKKCNDTYGHLAGDEVLRKVAAQIKNAVRSYDIFARYGGEEFVLLVPDATLDLAMTIAERIRRQVESMIISYKRASIKVTCSVGVAMNKKEGEKLEEFLGRADSALYQAKESGRNCVVLYGEEDDIRERKQR